VYLEHLTSPIDPKQQEKLSWGSNFHLLMQQLELDLPVELLLEEDQEIKEALIKLVRNNPEVFQQRKGQIRDPEHCRTLKFEQYLLTVIYDLLILSDERAQILDWKTYQKPPKKFDLAKNWQTRLYLYVLAETANYSPEQISMTYWFVKLPNNPESVTFGYNSTLHRQTREDLEALLTQCDRWLDNYLNQGIPFPHRQDCQDNCPHYKYLEGENQQAINNSHFPDWLKSLPEIEEIAIKG
jgi:hypothetical protein